MFMQYLCSQRPLELHLNPYMRSELLNVFLYVRSIFIGKWEKSALLVQIDVA